MLQTVTPQSIIADGTFANPFSRHYVMLTLSLAAFAVAFFVGYWIYTAFSSDSGSRHAEYVTSPCRRRRFDCVKDFHFSHFTGVESLAGAARGAIILFRSLWTVRRKGVRGAH